MSDNDERECKCMNCGAVRTYRRFDALVCNNCGSGDIYELAYRLATEPTQSQSSELDRLREENRELREDMTLLMDMVNMLLIKQDTVARDILPLEAAQQQVREVAADINQRLRLSRARARTEENGT